MNATPAVMPKTAKLARPKPGETPEQTMRGDRFWRSLRKAVASPGKPSRVNRAAWGK
jgi:hypothetical protein